VNLLLLTAGWGLVGAAAGWVVRWGSVRLAHLEGLEPDHLGWQVFGPPVLTAILFAVFAFHFGMTLTLLIKSVFILVLVQVIFFDFEHRLILDRVIFPSMVLALLLSLFGHPWWAGIATGVVAGLVFFLLAVAGSAIFKAEALGFGDVKLAAFMGLLLGPLPTAQALFYGVFLAGAASIGMIVWRRSLKGTLAYGPYLAAGALIVLYLLA
jgi:prepilin signal peptidase PulO-like enzyme (type II secretory pathway)